MKHGAFIGSAIIVAAAGVLSGPSQAQVDGKAECDRLISMLEQKPPAEARDALQQMRVFRQGNQYQACISTAQAGQSPSAAQMLGGAKIEVREKQPFGRYLTDSNGRAVYMFTADKPGASTCYDACAEAWPPVITSETPRKGEGVNDAMVDTLKRRDGKLQVTYNALPLYYFAKDQGPGSTAGQDVKGSGGEWYLVSPNGQKIEGGQKS